MRPLNSDTADHQLVGGLFQKAKVVSIPTGAGFCPSTLLHDFPGGRVYLDGVTQRIRTCESENTNGSNVALTKLAGAWGRVD